MKRSLVWSDEFLGHRIYSHTAGSNVGHSWLPVRTAAAGSPGFTQATPGRGVIGALTSTNEVQNICLAHADNLAFPIDDIVEVRMRVRMGQALMNAAEMFAFGLTSARNDAVDSIAQAAIFRLIGASATVLVETDDGVTDIDDIPTGATLATAPKDFAISFAAGKDDVRFFIDGQPVAESTRFDMSAYTGAFQPLFQMQKTQATSTGSFRVEWFHVTNRSE